MSARVEGYQPMKNYEEISYKMKVSVKSMLSKMYKKTNSIKEFFKYCTRYEEFGFQKLQEIEHDYIIYKKYYLCKAFAREFAIKLENNKLAKPLSDSIRQVPSNSSNSTADTSHSNQKCSPSTKTSSVYSTMSFNQILHPELIDTLFNQLVRALLKNKEFIKMMDGEDFMQSLFMLFQIEQRSRSEFANEIN